MKKKLHNFALFLLFLLISVAAFFLTEEHKAAQVDIHKEKQLDLAALTISKEVATLIQEKQNATTAMGLAFTQNKEAILALLQDPHKQARLQEFSARIKENSDFKNIWIQILDPKGKSLVRSWTSRTEDDVARIRPEVQKLIYTKEIMSLISVGLYDMSFKSMIPLFDPQDRFIGIIEFISHFNSIAENIKAKGYEPLVIVDAKYSEKIIYPFTQKYVGKNYVANINADQKILDYVHAKGLENLVSKRKNYVVDETNGYLIVNYKLADFDGNTMADFLMFKPLSGIDFVAAENVRLHSNFILTVFVIFVGFVLYLVANREKEEPKKTNKKDFFVFFGIYLFLMGGYFVLSKITYDSAKEDFLTRHAASVEKEYTTALEYFYANAKTLFEVVINKPQVLELMHQAYDKDPDVKNSARFALYKLLQKDYEFYRQKDLRQLHFHLRNNESFLRFHKPELFGDDLSSVRKSVVYVNKTRSEIAGYEEGKIYNGFRYLFPLERVLPNGTREHLGSVETSFSSYAILQHFLQKKETKVGFLLSKEDIKAKNYKEEQSLHYKDSELQNFYYEQTIHSLLEEKLQHVDTRLLATQAQRIENEIAKKEVFSLAIEESNTIITFLPIKNLLCQDLAALLVVQNNEESFHTLRNNFMIFLLSGFVIITLVMLYVYKEFSSKRKFEYFSNKIRNVFDFQKEIVLITNGVEAIDANKQLLNFFGFESFEAFKKKHKCICERFEEYAQVFHLKKIDNPDLWVEAIAALPPKERIVAMSDASGNKHLFSVLIGRFNDEYIISFSDISDTILEQFSLKERVKRDKLTGAYNREYFDKNIELLKLEARSKNLYLGVIIFDIDDFKKVNDTYGHSCGDNVLIELVKLIKKNIRKSDVLIRWGGEEFMLLIMTESVDVLEGVVEQLRKKIELFPFEEVKRITCSFGVTVYKEGEDIKNTIIRADKALYKSKVNGKNCFSSVD